ncbi:MAG: hypothetical protein G5701_08950 [Serratia symbiotica]|nr:hypothetical protein [Serratia symbiotica]
MKITLVEWAAVEFSQPYKKGTLWMGARTGRIDPPAEKIGRNWWVYQKAKYVNPQNPKDVAKKPSLSANINLRSVFMAARPRSRKHKDLPPNLYESQGHYQWRDPRDGKRYGLGTDKTDAINEAVVANLMIYNLQNKLRLADRLQGADIMTLGNHLHNFLGIRKKRELADSTLRQRGLQIGYIKDKIGDLLLSRVTKKSMAGMMDSYVHQGKKATAVKLRRRLNDAFNEAIAAGHIKDNPVTPTQAPANKVSISRLTVTEYHQIFEATGDQQ